MPFNQRCTGNCHYSRHLPLWISITAALWLGLDQQTAVKFSSSGFDSVIFGATLFELKDVLAFGFTGINSSLVIGTLASLFTGIFAIRIFVNLLQKVSSTFLLTIVGSPAL